MTICDVLGTGREIMEQARRDQGQSRAEGLAIGEPLVVAIDQHLERSRGYQIPGLRKAWSPVVSSEERRHHVACHEGLSRGPSPASPCIRAGATLGSLPLRQTVRRHSIVDPVDHD
jgi:hypothetical protein